MVAAVNAKAVQLAYPVETAGDPITEIVFRRPKAKDMALIAKVEALRADIETGGDRAAETEAALLLIRALSGQPEDVVAEIDLFADLPRLAEEAGGFLEAITPEARPEVPTAGEA